MGMAVQLNKAKKLSYSVQAKRAFPITANGLVGINLKGRFYFSKGFKEVCTFWYFPFLANLNCEISIMTKRREHCLGCYLFLFSS